MGPNCCRLCRSVFACICRLLREELYFCITDTMGRKDMLARANSPSERKSNKCSRQLCAVVIMDPEIARLMADHEIEEDVAEKAQELIDEGIDEDEAVELEGQA